MATACPAAWRRILHDQVPDTDVVTTLEAIAKHSLLGYEQHMAVLECPGLIEATVGCMSRCPQATVKAHNSKRPPPVSLSNAVETAAIEAAISLTVSKQGLQALCKAGAVDATCRALLSCCQALDQRHGKRARQGSRMNPSQADEELQEIVALALQLLVVLLLEPSATRPAAGALDPDLTAATSSALLEMLPRVCWCWLSERQQLDAAAVLMRLAMEPEVLDLVCQQQQIVAAEAAVAAAAVDTSNEQAAAAGSGTGCNPEAAAGAPHFSIGDLLGGDLAEAAFWSSHWETAPVVCRAQQAVSHGSTHSTKQPRTASRQQGLVQSVAQLLVGQLTPAVVMEHLLPRVRRCPILDSAVDDPVEVLHQLRTRGQLLQPPVLNEDLRIIKTEPAAGAGGATAPQPPTASVADATHPLDELAPAPPHGSLLQQAVSAAQQPTSAEQGSPPSHAPGDGSTGSGGNAPQPVKEEVLLGLSGHVTAGSCRAALQAGFSLVLRDIPKRCLVVGQLAEALEEELGLPAGANLYLTPQGAQGLQAHYDDHDVFVLQLSGSKSWQIGPPQHPPLPLTYQRRLPVLPPSEHQAEPAIPMAGAVSAAQQQQQQEQHVTSQDAVAGQQGCGAGELAAGQLQQLGQAVGVLLQPGDCLYIPRGWVHQAVVEAPAAAAEAAAAARSSTHVPNAPWAGASLHLSVGLDVSAESSVQGFLHYLINVCEARVCADFCGTIGSHSHGSGGTSSVPEQQQQQQQGRQQRCTLAVSAAALQLHMRLWQQARERPVYRKACPLLATSSTAQALSDTLLHQLQLAHRSLQWHPPPQYAQGSQGLAAASCELTPTAAVGRPSTQLHGHDKPAQPDGSMSCCEPLLLLHDCWITFAAQQLLQDSSDSSNGMQPMAGPAIGGVQMPAQNASSQRPQPCPQHSISDTAPAACHTGQMQLHAAACSSTQVDLLTDLITELLSSTAAGMADPCAGEDGAGSTHPGTDRHGTGQDRQASSFPPGLLDLMGWLQAATCSSCEACSGSFCHSAVLCAAAVLAQAALQAGPQHRSSRLCAVHAAAVQHIEGCTCCARHALCRCVGVQSGVPQLDAACESMSEVGAGNSSGCTSCMPGESQAGAVTADFRKPLAASRSRAELEDASRAMPGAVTYKQLQHAAMQLDTALAAMASSLLSDSCQSAAAASYVSSAKARLAACQAVRRGFLAVAMLLDRCVVIG